MTNPKKSIIPALAMWLGALMLLVPNIALDITEVHYGFAARALNILIPAAAYLALLAWSRKVGRTILLLIPVMVLCAFQIVLLFLYGESIIAVDMFLNVVTTNSREAGELLKNLSAAIALVCALYLPLIGTAIYLMMKGRDTTPGQRRPARLAAMALGGASLAVVVMALSQGEPIRPSRTLFPVNVICNMLTAGERTVLTEEYDDTSAGFTFHATSSREASGPEVYVLVIGETSRADNWQINGYARNTNPRLSRRDGVVSFSKALSESNTTHKSVPLLMSHLSSKEFADSIYRTKGIIEAFKEAGYSTAWLSNQQRNGALIDFFGEEADTATFLVDDGADHFDMELCGHLRDALADTARTKTFVAIHTYGSHFNYKERCPEEMNVFGPEIATEAAPENRPGLMNAYDNTIVYTDAVLDSIASILDSCGRPAAMLYVADHGEDIYDDSRHRFLHASPTPTYYQIHVPMILWMSQSYRDEHPGQYERALANAGRDVSSSRSTFHTLLSMAGISTPCLDREASLTSKIYSEPERVYLNDYNESVPLKKSGVREPDLVCFRAHGIDF